MQKALYRQAGLTLDQGEKLLAEAQMIDQTGIEAMLVSFITSDSSARDYDPKDPKSWTEKMWLGIFEMLVAGDNVDALRKVGELDQRLWVETGRLEPDTKTLLDERSAEYDKVRTGPELARLRQSAITSR